MKQLILASTSVVAILATPAFAQSQPETPPAAENAPQGAAVGTTDPAAEGGIPDVIITAQRTEQSAQRAPLAIDVVRPEELVRQNVTRPEDLARVAPSLVGTNNGGANTTFFLRGVGNFTNNSYSDPAIAFNYDGVYLGRPTNAQGLFYDLQRVEVLKGPQGTLYGRNATGGAVNVIPNRPVPGRNSGEFSASYGNYDAVQGQAAVNIATGTGSALRLAGTFARHDGYLSDGTSDQKMYGLRGQFLAEVTPDLTTRLGVDYTHDGGKGKGSYQYGTTFLSGTEYLFVDAPGLNPKIGVLDPRTNAFFTQQFIASVGRRADALTTKPYQDNSFWGVTNETNWRTSAGTLTVQAAYREGHIDSLSTAAQFRGFLTREDNSQVSVEARFGGKLGSLDYLVGAFYFDEEIDADLVINQITSTPFQTYKTGTESKAVFGRLAWHATPELTFTAGGRYTKEHKKFDGLSNVYTLACGPPAPPQDLCPTLQLMPFFETAEELVAFYQAQGVRFGPPGSAGANRPTIGNTRILSPSSSARPRSAA